MVFITLCIYCFVSLHILKYFMFSDDTGLMVDPLGAAEIINWCGYSLVLLMTIWSFF